MSSKNSSTKSWQDTCYYYKTPKTNKKGEAVTEIASFKPLRFNKQNIIALLTNQFSVKSWFECEHTKFLRYFSRSLGKVIISAHCLKNGSAGRLLNRFKKCLNWWLCQFSWWPFFKHNKKGLCWFANWAWTLFIEKLMVRWNSISCINDINLLFYANSS